MAWVTTVSKGIGVPFAAENNQLFHPTCTPKSVPMGFFNSRVTGTAMAWPMFKWLWR